MTGVEETTNHPHGSHKKPQNLPQRSECPKQPHNTRVLLDGLLAARCHCPQHGRTRGSGCRQPMGSQHQSRAHRAVYGMSAVNVCFWSNVAAWNECTLSQLTPAAQEEGGECEVSKSCWQQSPGKRISLGTKNSYLDTGDAEMRNCRNAQKCF